MRRDDAFDALERCPRRADASGTQPSQITFPTRQSQFDGDWSLPGMRRESSETDLARPAGGIERPDGADGWSGLLAFREALEEIRQKERTA